MPLVKLHEYKMLGEIANQLKPCCLRPFRWHCQDTWRFERFREAVGVESRAQGQGGQGEVALLGFDSSAGRLRQSEGAAWTGAVANRPNPNIRVTKYQVTFEQVATRYASPPPGPTSCRFDGQVRNRIHLAIFCYCSTKKDQVKHDVPDYAPKSRAYRTQISAWWSESTSRNL